MPARVSATGRERAAASFGLRGRSGELNDRQNPDRGGLGDRAGRRTAQARDHSHRRFVDGVSVLDARRRGIRQDDRFKTPVVESTGTGGGFKLFCEGVGVDKADISNASRAIKKSEVESCAKNGVTEITEVKIGYDGIVLANSKASPQLNITLEQLYLALAKDVPDGKRLQTQPE